MRARDLTSLLMALVLASPMAAAKPKGKGKKPKTEEATKSSKISVRVVDVAGGRAYIEPGATAGLRVGDTIEFGRRKYTVVGVTSSTAVLELDKSPLAVGTKTRATLDLEREPEKIAPLPPPAQLAAFRGIWPDAKRPASNQHPTPIPLGPILRTERSSVAFSLAGHGVAPTGGSGEGFAHAELRGVLHYEPFVETPFSLDADVAAQSFLGGSFSARTSPDSRPLLRVRALQAAYGNEGAFLAALGRLRHASGTLGSLDGVKLAAPLFSGLSIGAFGGFIQDPISGAISSRASRFGGEIAWEAADAEWRPRAVIGGYASQFEGALDERRVSFLFDANPSFGRLGVDAEASFFDADNPWNADTAEISTAGADVALRAGPLELGGRLAMQRPERSRYLASFLPPEWLCITRTSATQPQPCIGNDATYIAAFDTSLSFSKARLSAGANTSRTENATVEQSSAFGNLRLLDLIGRMRLDAGAMGSQGSLLDTAAFTLSPGIVFMNGDADVSLRYRPALIRYQASTEAFVEHSLGGALWLSPSRSVDITLDADYVTGRDLDAVIVQSAMVWRSGF